MSSDTKHNYSHNGHSHGHSHAHGFSDISGGKLLFATLLNVIITVAEVIGGILSNSLALLSDAVHNLGDTIAIAIAYIANRIGKRKANERKTFGVVTGLGFSFNDYAFSDPVTVEKEGGAGNIVPVGLYPDENSRSIKKSKLHVNYITAPLFLEVKTPLRMGSSRLYLAGGVIGSLYLGSHTKYKYYKGDSYDLLSFEIRGRKRRGVDHDEQPPRELDVAGAAVRAGGLGESP